MWGKCLLSSHSAFKENPCPLDLCCGPLSRVMFWWMALEHHISIGHIYLPDNCQKWGNICGLTYTN